MKYNKICFISPKAYQLFNSEVKSTFGGAEVQLSLLAKEFAKNKNLNIHFMVADYGQKKIEEYENVRIWKSLNYKKNILNQIWSFFMTFNKINADIYIQMTLSYFSGLIALYCLLKGKKFIFMFAHDKEVDNMVTYDKEIDIIKKSKKYKNIITDFLINLNFKLASLIIVQNEFQKKILKENKNRDSVLINSVIKIENNNFLSKKYILWVSRSESWKKPELFLELAKTFPDENFIMICPPSTNNPELSKRTEENARKISNIKFIRFVSYDKIDIYFNEAKVFVNTSDYEGFPNTFMQASKNKTPIISLNVNPDNFLEIYNCGFYCNGDFDLMKKRLENLLKDTELYNKMADNAFKYVKENHNVNSIIKLFYKHIDKLYS